MMDLEQPTSADDRGVHVQHLSLEIDPETYIAQVAPAELLLLMKILKSFQVR